MHYRSRSYPIIHFMPITYFIYSKFLEQSEDVKVEETSLDTKGAKELDGSEEPDEDDEFENAAEDIAVTSDEDIKQEDLNT